MEKIKEFLAKPVGMVALFGIGAVAGFYFCKRKKRTPYARR